MTPEGKVKQAVKKYLNRLPKDQLWYYCAQDRFTPAIPDIIGVCCGFFFAIEIKAPGEKPRALQQIVLRAIRAAGGIAGWVDNTHDAIALVEEAQWKAQSGKK